MPETLSIGDFSRATQLSIKALRHYHRTGLLEPAGVDPATRYRRYTLDQIATAQVIRRFRDLDMPVAAIREVLTARDVEARNAAIAAHLGRLEANLERTHLAVTSLRDLLQPPPVASSIAHRRVAGTSAVAISAVVELRDAWPWLCGALGELRETLAARGVTATGHACGIYSDELVTRQRGTATLFVPCDDAIRPAGRVVPFVAPAAELATIVHAGPHGNIDLAYGSLATYVTRHALAVDGPLRECYLVGPHDTPDASAWRTELGWPIFTTREDALRPLPLG